MKIDCFDIKYLHAVLIDIYNTAVNIEDFTSDVSDMGDWAYRADDALNEIVGVIEDIME